MNIFSIIGHLGVINGVVKSVENMVAEVVKTKSAPTKESVKDLLQKTEALFDSGIIDIPGVEEKDISMALRIIEEQFCP